MFKLNFPSAGDLTKMVAAAAERKNSEKAKRAASPFGGVRVRFRHKSGGALDSVEFEGSEAAVQAARAAVAN